MSRAACAVFAFAAGRLTRTRSSIGDMHLSYDALGRVDARAFVDPAGEQYFERTERHYDGTPSVLELQLPDAPGNPERYSYSYDSAGRMRSVAFEDSTEQKQLYAATVIDPFGRVRSARYGGTVAFTADYEDHGRRLPRIEQMRLDSGRSRSIEHVSYDAIGRELQRGEAVDGAQPSTTTNAYDALGRLSSVTGHGTYSYDPLGNVLRLADSDAHLTFQTPDRDRICHIDFGSAPPETCNVVHDDSGNVIEPPAQDGSVRVLRYFPSGAIWNIKQGGLSAAFRNDGSGEISELDMQGPAGAADWRRDRRYGLVVRRDVDHGAESILVRHIPGDGGIVATRRGAGGPWIFPFAEERGTRFVAGEGNDFVQDVSYLPFGKSTSDGAQPGTPEHTTDQWNGGDALGSFGIVHLGARLYDPTIGRFLSRDPLFVPRFASTTNPYAFALNDPVNLGDPTGLDPCAGNDLCLWASNNSDSSSASMIFSSAATLGALAANLWWGSGREPPVPTYLPAKQLYGYFDAFDARSAVVTSFHAKVDELVHPNGAVDQAIGGAGDLVWAQVEGLGYMVRHPIDGNPFLNGSLSRPGEKLWALFSSVDDIIQRVASGDARAAGYGLSALGSALLPGAVVKLAAKIDGGATIAGSTGAGAAGAAALPEGSFSIIDWSGYPQGLPRPSGPFRLLQGAEYETARKAANDANRALHRANPALASMQLHEIHPVKFGGSPTDPANKVPLSRAAHSPASTFWYILQRSLEGR